jgi:serine/threonine protein kinase/Tol biopolymer transport system component
VRDPSENEGSARSERPDPTENERPPASARPAAGAASVRAIPTPPGLLLGGRYLILAELGHGGEGAVFRARDTKADTVVALKLLPLAEGSDERLRRFRRGLQMARRITHPNVVRIYDLVELPDHFGLSMELVSGEPLDARIARAPLAGGELVRLALDLARALAAAHEAGVLHRDLKPGNVLLRARDGSAVITDFGVSRAHLGEGIDLRSAPAAGEPPVDVTCDGVLVGTPLYMAPEQLDGRADVGPAADVYALGMLLFEAATGKLVHEAKTLDALRALRRTSPAPRLRELRPDLPRRLCDAVDRALQREEGDRFANGVELLAALEPLAAAPARRHAARLRAAAIGALLVASGVAGFLAKQPASPTPRPTAPVGPRVAPSSPAPASSTTPPLELHVANVHRLTFGDSCEEFPSFTPDGRAVVFDETVGPDSFIERLDLTPGAVAESLTHVRGWDIAAAIAPQGDRFAFLRLQSSASAAYVAPFDGHEPPHLVAKGSVRPSWTRDGTAIWAGDGARIAAYDASTGAVLRSLEGAPTVKSALTADLGDGRVLGGFTWRSASDGYVSGVVLWPAEGPPDWLYRAPIGEVLSVTSDHRHVLTSRTTPTGIELIDVPVDGSPVTSLAATGIEAREGLGWSRDGKHVVWSACREVWHLSRTEGRGAWRPVEVDLSDVSSVAPVPGRSEVAVVSSRAGRRELWIAPLSGAPPRAVSIGSLSASEMALSGDARTFVVAVPDEGLHVGSLEGGPPRRLTSEPTDSSPSFRFGDKEVVFTRHSPDGRRQVMAAPVEGGEAIALLDVGSDLATPSPTDDRIAYLAGFNFREVLPMVWDGRTGTRRALSPKLPPGFYTQVRFSQDGLRVAVVRAQTEIVEVSAASGAIVRTLATPNNDILQQATYTKAGLVAVVVSWQGNLWMADVVP